MFKRTQANINYIVFSRWSRKSYAIFASLRKVVVIAQLAVDICVSALQKNETVIQLLSIFNDEEAYSTEVDINEIDESLQVLFVPVNTAKSNPCRKLNKEILYNPYFVLQSMGFFVLIGLIIN